MYQNAAILAAVILLYAAISARVERSWLSGPILFAAAGILLGPLGFNVLHISIEAADLKVMAEVALAMVLFSDAAHSNLGVVRRSVGLPERLLLIGLPLTIVLGFLAAVALFPTLNIFSAALLAVVLAPTDAALGEPVVTNKAVPATIREALNLESGLNDGICVPVVIILLDFAIGMERADVGISYVILVIVEEIGIGVLVGVVLVGAAVVILRLSTLRDWTGGPWLKIAMVALAAFCFATAQALGGSGFIACYAGGLLFSYLRHEIPREALGGAASTGEVLSLVIWVVFGSQSMGLLAGELHWSMLVYAVLSLTVIRMVPVFLSLLGTGLGTRARLFIGWFGPRGLASIVFAVMIFNAGIPGRETVVLTAAVTILLSVVVHGATANVLITALQGRRAGVG